MKIFRIVGFVMIVMLGAGFYYVESDIGLLGDDYLLQMVSTDVIGNPLYGKSCQRSSYAKKVEVSGGKNEGKAALFKFHPINGMEKECPPVSVITDRKTGEAWIR